MGMGISNRSHQKVAKLHLPRKQKCSSVGMRDLDDNASFLVLYHKDLKPQTSLMSGGIYIPLEENTPKSDPGTQLK
jgi:hypothetical protein